MFYPWEKVREIHHQSLPFPAVTNNRETYNILELLYLMICTYHGTVTANVKQRKYTERSDVYLPVFEFEFATFFWVHSQMSMGSDFRRNSF